MAIKAIVAVIQGQREAYTVGELLVTDYPDFGTIVCIGVKEDGFIICGDRNASTFYTPDYIERVVLGPVTIP